MTGEGVRVYLLVIDSDSLLVLWANHAVEDLVVQWTGSSAVGQHLDNVIPFSEELGLPARLHDVALDGETRHMHTTGFSATGEGTRTDASLYRLPTGELLLASEYSVGGVRQ